MKSILLTLFLVVSAHADILAKISFLESNHNDKAIGKQGEVSRYQFLPYVWHSYSSSTNYSDKTIAKAVATKHLTFITNAWSLNRPLTDTDIIIIWNKGFTGYSRQSFIPTKSDLKRLTKLTATSLDKNAVKQKQK